MVARHQLGKLPPDQILRPVSEDRPSAGSLVSEDAVFIEDGDDIGGVSNQRAMTLFTMGKRQGFVGGKRSEPPVEKSCEQEQEQQDRERTDHRNREDAWLDLWAKRARHTITHREDC